ncbi:hypothetical protein [Vineibacter terrae]|uniref:hypothetical protein n=1 Tax=Vineibacter terrae TaxID=2586908 RepID=UPI001C49ACF1|nr:hypothetical protein [Vineibacter terrae]
MLDVAHAILQNGEAYQGVATDAFQEVVADLYDGFLSAEDRRGVPPPDHDVLSPLVKWGKPQFGPYTWPSDATERLGVEAAIVSLPPAHGRGGLLAWAALAHEAAGHDVVHANDGLESELSDKVRAALSKYPALADYWADRMDETAADVLGILNMGPSAGIGLIGYFRGLRAVFDGVARLSNEASPYDPHPADILRGFLAAEVVRLCPFAGRDAWADAILQETLQDWVNGQLRIAGKPIDQATARSSAEVVAQAIAQSHLTELGGHSLASIQTWRDRDEQIVDALCQALGVPVGLSAELTGGVYAAHVVAAAVRSALRPDADIALIFTRMLRLLKQMHDSNPAWGPLFVMRRGDIARHRIWPGTGTGDVPVFARAPQPARPRAQGHAAPRSRGNVRDAARDLERAAPG